MMPVDDPQRRRPDIKMVKENLGWRPSISLEQGLVKTLAYFKSLLRECSRTPEMLVFAH